MNRNWKTAIGALTCVAVLAFQSMSWAQTPTANQVTTKGEWSETVQQLRAAHKLLAEADRDYNGHRAKAAEEVEHAIHELVGHHHHKKPVQPVTAPTTTATATTNPTTPIKTAPVKHGGELQATSDAQLKQAQTILTDVQGELTSRHPKAAGRVQAAITEITTALAIK